MTYKAWTKMMMILASLAALLGLIITIGGFFVASDVRNRSSSATNRYFEIHRRVIFYNVSGEYFLQIEGRCNLGNSDNDNVGNRITSITCKIGPDSYKKHYLGNMMFFAEQMDATPDDIYPYRVTSKPGSIIPDIEVR